MANYVRTPPAIRAPRTYRLDMADGSYWSIISATSKTALHTLQKMLRQAGTTGAAATVVSISRSAWQS